MKKIMLFSFLVLLSVQTSAQEATEQVTEEEMMRYAAMEDSVTSFIQGKQENLIVMIKEDETLGGAARYNELKAAWGDEDKLTEINATEEEKAAFKEIQNHLDSLGKDVVRYKTDLIMDPEVLGAASYVRVKKAMDSDPSVKEKVDSLIAELKSKRATDDIEFD